MKKQSIEFVEAKKPISDLVTKFGGQPSWINDPQWPVSATTKKPMRFICQIAIDSQIFKSIEAQMAYVFMTDDEDHVDGTWEPDGGENAVILQPGNPAISVQCLTQGPTLYRMVKKMFQKKLVPESCEFSVKSVAGEDPAFAPESERSKWSEDQWKEYSEALDGNKIGGNPIFIQSDEFPGPGSWKLLMQLDSTRVPFFVNFGDCGIGYAFISEDGKVGKFLWQCA